MRGGPKSWARRQIEPFPSGARVTAYYDPADPAEAFLVHRPSWLPWLFALVPSLLPYGWLRLRAAARLREARKQAFSPALG